MIHRVILLNSVQFNSIHFTKHNIKLKIQNINFHSTSNYLVNIAIRAKQYMRFLLILNYVLVCLRLEINKIS
jgi:hypothetical protein